MVLACFRESDKKLIYIRYFDQSRKSLVGNVYSARVEKKVPGVGVFLVIPEGHAFVKEKDAKNPVYIKRQSPRKELSEGDLVLIQIKKDAIKTKEPEATFSIELSTPYFVIRRPGSGVSFSKKLKREDRERFSQISLEKSSLLIRTAASRLDENELYQKISSENKKLEQIFSDGKNHTSPALVFEDLDILNTLLTAFPFAANRLNVTKIKTGDTDICEKLGSCGEFYKDEGLSLLDLYRIRTITERLLSKTVWLSSGANIIIEQTEALTVIDVNSARAKKSLPVSVNREAAAAIAEQIRLRNLSGIIIIDFMKMSSDDERGQIISLMRSLTKSDFAKVNVEDFTKLGLLELTREKIFPSVKQTLTSVLHRDIISDVDAQ